jgi:hypothetical protein
VVQKALEACEPAALTFDGWNREYGAHQRLSRQGAFVTKNIQSMQVTIKQVAMMVIFHPVLICLSIRRLYNSSLSPPLHRDGWVCGSTLGKSGREPVSKSAKIFQIGLTTSLGISRLVRLSSHLRRSSGNDDGEAALVRLVYHLRLEVLWNALRLR